MAPIRQDPVRPYPVKPLAAGLKSARNGSLLADGQTPRCRNVEFNDDSIRTSRGSIKVGNQTAPKPALRTRIDPAYSPLYVDVDKSVPTRGYVVLPYSAVTDIGGDFAASGAFPTQTFHQRRGRGFERNISVTIPEDFRMFDRGQKGAGAPAAGIGAIETAAGYDEGLDDCCLILQKGGDRLAPMSWAIGIVNAGNWENWTGAAATARKSNYFFVFMWLDSAEWCEGNQANMRYDLTNPSNAAASGAYSTQALRAVILDGRDDTRGYAIEAGRTYHISVALKLDTASVLGSSWNSDGRLDFRVQEQDGPLYAGSFVDSGGGGTTTNLTIWKGPTDSLRYLSKYGVRYSGRDAEFVGLGYRGAPWNEQGFIPFGMDSAAMERKGFRVTDCSAQNVDDIFGVGLYTLTCTHPVGANTFININSHRGLTEANANGAQTPLGPLGARWAGFGGPADDTGAPATNFNSEALRGYRVVFPGKATINANLNGAVFSITTYIESALNDYRLGLTGINGIATTWAPERAFLIRAFRWNQQDLVIGNLKMWSAPRDYTDARVVFDLRSTLRLEDGHPTLVAYWPMTDGGGGVVRELVRGLDGYLAPFGLGVGSNGAKGEETVFLSGEGEALTLDLSTNPVFLREFGRMLQSNRTGVAIELTMMMPEAHYGLAVNTPSGTRSAEYEAAYTPDLVQLAVKNADEAGQPNAAPLLTFGHHAWWQFSAGTNAQRRPMGFQVDVHRGLDQESRGMSTAVLGTTIGTATLNYDPLAPWVGQKITVQVGVEPSPANRAGTAGKQNEYRVYLAATPKGFLKPLTGESPQAEVGYWSELAVQKKDLLRSIITIGGGWNPNGPRGYTEYRARMVVDEVRIYATAAAGALPAVSGDATPDGTGKILGQFSLPQRALELADILRPVGPGTRSVTLTDGSTQQRISGNGSFFTESPSSTVDSLLEKYLLPLSDTHESPSLDTYLEIQEDFYWVQAIATDGKTLTLATPYDGPSSSNAGAAALSMVGYTRFSRARELLRRRPLSIGSGAAYKPGTTRTRDLVLSEPLFENVAPVTGAWRMTIAAPFTQGGLANVLPKWVRGVAAPRANPITGIAALDDALFASAQGSLFQVDDRWREEGPTQALRRSLAITAKRVGTLEQSFPLVNDGVRFSNYTNAWPYWTSALHRDFTWVFDAWVWCESYAGLQTIAWLGCEYANMLQLPAASDARRGVGIWARLNGGRLELVRESLGNYAGGATPPPDGRYVASSTDRVPLRRWTHVRIYMEHQFAGGFDVLRTPGMAINGRPSSVLLNAVETGLGAGEWIKANNGGGLAGSEGDARNVLYLRVARDAARIPSKGQSVGLSGQEVRPARLIGRMHALAGKLADVVVWRVARTDPLVAGFPAFDPFSLDYTGRAVRFRARLQEGVGYKVDDTATETQVATPATVGGQVLSHPLIDLYNELGDSERRTSFATFQQRVYAANGGRVAFMEEGRGGPAGILAPTTPPSYRVERKPLWEPNVAPPLSSSVDQDPIAQAAVGAGSQINHYSTFGNHYLSQVFSEEMKWTKADAVANTPFDIFGLKTYFHPRDVAGKTALWSQRRSPDSGSIFVECVDGRARVGWYDTYLKRQVYVETSSPVFRAGRYYTIYLRKGFPLQDSQEGNWLNSFWANGRRRHATFTPGVAGWAVGDVVRNGGATKRGVVTKITATVIEYVLFTSDADFAAAEAVNNGAGATGTIAATPFQNTGDALVVREHGKEATILERSAWQAKASVRSSISFTASMPRSLNTTAIGQVTPKGIFYDGAAAGVVNVRTAVTDVPVFHGDMVGMYWQFSGVSAAAPEKVYRIVQVNSAQQAVVADEFGVNPNLTAFSSLQGGVFSGVDLVKSSGFDSSNAPDQTGYTTEFMGSVLARDPSSGYGRLSAKFASFAWHIAASNVSATAFYSGFAPFFETAAPTDLSEIGTDTFAALIDNPTTRPGELKVDSAFTAVDCQTYPGQTPTSTQPNANLEVALDTMASQLAESLYWRALEEQQQKWARHLVRVIFYDADQAVRSNPSPKLVIEPFAEDAANPSAATRLVLENLPVSHQPGDVQRWIFVSLGDGADLFRQVIVPDNTAGSCSFELDERKLELVDVLTNDNDAPPDAAVIGVSQNAMWFGDVVVGGASGPDLLFFSKPYFPVNVPLSNVLTMVSGRGEHITAMADHAGKLCVWKRDSFARATLRDGAAVWESRASNAGAPGPQAVAVVDGRAYWVSTDRGLYVYMGSGEPIWLGENVADIFSGENGELDVDPQQLAGVSVTISRRRDQVVVAYRGRQDRDARRRLSSEFDSEGSGSLVPGATPNGFRYSAYSDPRLTAVGAVDSSSSGPQRLVGGTEEGFIVWLDRSDTQIHLAGATPKLFNPLTVVISGVATATRWPITPVSYLTDLEGIRGAKLAWVDAQGVVREEFALFSDGSALYLDRAASALPPNGTVVSIGWIEHIWESKWFDFMRSDMRKKPHFLSITQTKQASGQAVLEFFKDFETVAHQVSMDIGVVSQAPLDLTQPSLDFPLGEIRGNFLKFRVRTLPAHIGVAFEITEAVFNFQDSEPR